MAGIMRRKGEKRVYTGREEVNAGEYKGGALRAKGQSRSGLTVGETVGYAAKRAGTDFLRVGEGVVDAALVPVDLLTGNVDRAKSRFMGSPVDAMRERLDEEYNPGKVAGFIGDIAGGIGQSVGYGLISAIPYAGTPMMYSSIVEQSISSAAEKTGEVGWKEVGYGATAGAVEGLLESKLGAGVNAVKGIGSAILKKTGINVAESAAKAGGKTMLKSVLTETAKGAAGEFAEEAISEAVDPALLRLYNIDENAQFSLKDVAYAGLIGGLSGGMMSAGPAAINYRSSVSVGRALQERGLDGDLIKRAKYTLSALEAAQTRSTSQIKGKPEGDTKETAKEWLSRTAENRKVKRLSRETKELADKVRKNINAYESYIKDPRMAKSEPVAALLGELRGNLFLVGYAYEADVIEQVMMDATDEQRQAFVDTVNEELAAQGKKHDYTLADFDANKDDIRRGLAGLLMADEMQGYTAEYGAEATESPVEPAQAPKDTTAEEVAAQEENAATEDLSGIEEEVWRAVTDETVKGYGTQNEQEVALLRAAVSQNVPEKSIPLMLERFREGTDMTPAEFADAWADGVLLFGRLGLNEATISQESALSRMSEKARHASIEYGKWLSEEQRSKEQKAAKKKKRPVKEGASKKPKGEVVRHPGINLKADLDDAQFTAYKAAEIMATALKADIEIHKGLKRDGKEVNGYYDLKTNTIHINIDAVRDGKHIALYTLGHEVTHYIKEWSPKKFYELGDYVMNQLGEGAEQAIRDKLDFLKRNDLVKGLDETEAYDRAYEEVVADGMELVLTDGTVLDALARENKTLWQKIKDRIFEIIEKIKKAYNDLSKTSRTAQILSETMDSLDEIEQLFYEGVTEAGERTRTAEAGVIVDDTSGTAMLSVDDIPKTERRTNDTAYLAAVERGDMETAQKMVNEAAKAAGYDIKAYHGTTNQEEHRKWDSKRNVWETTYTPFTVFKRQYDEQAGHFFSSDENNAGGYGSYLYSVYLMLKKPLVIECNGQSYNSISFDGQEMDTYEWAEYARKRRYDGVVFKNVRDGVGYNDLTAPTTDYVVFDSNRIKSADPVTYDNNGDIIPLSERFKVIQRDIRYSIDETPETPDVSDSAAETNVGSKTVEELEAENKRLTEKVQRMSFERFRRAVKDGEIAAKEQRQALSRGADAVLESIGVHDGRNRRELLRRMSETYAHMAAEKGITYEEVFEESGEIAKWLISRQPLVRDAAMVEQAKETINTLRGTKIRLTYAQKMEVANTLGSSDEYRKAMFGRITVSEKDGVPLDVQWAEWADQYPDLFDKDTPEADMPERLREIYDRLADMRDRVETVDEYIDETALTATIFTQIGQIGYGAEAAPFNDRAVLADMLSGAAVTEQEYKIIKDYKAASDELAANDRRLAELRRETAELNREIKVLQDKLRGIDKTKREPWVMTALTDAIKRKGELMDEMDALDEKLRAETDKLLSLASAKQLRKLIRAERSKAAAMERSAERARQREMDSKEWAKETVKKAREESEEKVKKARQEAQDYKAAVYKTSMEKVYKARREATDYKQAVYRTAYAKADEKNQKYRDRLDEMAKQSMERREITIRMREARRVLGYLNTMLYHPTKQKHVPESLQALVDKALRSADPKQFGINRDHIREMSELAGKIRKLESKAGRTTAEQETLDKMKTKYEKLEAETISVKRQAEALMTAFEQYVTSTTDGEQIDKNMLEGLRQTVTEIEEAPLNEMTLKSLKAVEKIYTVIYHQVNTANQAFATKKAANIDEMSTEANTQVKEAKELKVLSPRSREWAALAGVRSFLWKNMKPLTVFEAIGSDKLMEIFRRVLDAEDVWITDILEAKKALDEAKKEFGYNKWNLKERREVTTADGSKVSLTLGEMMSLYAYMFREQAEEHLSVGGFVFAPDAKTVEKFKGSKALYQTHLNDQTPHRMRPEDIAKMSALLTEEQRAYARAVQEYLTSLGAKGNEVSRKLYGIDLFKETAYFPIKSSHDYIETQTGKSGDPNIKSRGTFKETVPKAGNPIVLQDFMEVVGDHVNTMAIYHSFVLPVEDLTRVWNYTPVNIKRDENGKAILDENGMPVADDGGEGGYNSLKAEITKKYGKEANDYILQLLRDLNGGARRESAASILDKGLTAFKRSATMLSLSTIVQQPTSILRAMAYVDAKHFKGASFVPWETVKKYAPVAAIKEIGGHDTSTGARTADYINSKEYENQKDKLKAAALGILPESYGGDKQARDEYFGWLTSKADEVSWRYMFGAIVNEQAEKLGKPKDSEEVLKAAGERFAEVVRRTQVYDSTLTRSEYMRSKDGLMKMATAFGAEPTTVVSMVADAIIKAERGDKTFLRKSAAGIAFSVIANAAVASLIYAMRDDDEDETIPEKYVQSLTSELIEGFNPLEYLPIARDIMSMFKGYEIERSDMALVGNLMEQVELITSSKRSVPDKIFGVTGAVSAFFGLPVTNVYRDFKGLVKTGQSFTDAEEQTGAGLGHAMGDAVRGQFNLFSKLFGADSRNAYELYTAYVRGDTAHYERVKARYKTPQAAEMALRTELRDNDKRISEAAQARLSGDLAVYESLVDQIESEGIFDRNIVIRAINNEMLDLKDEDTSKLVPKDETVTEEEETAESLYKASDLNNALERGDAEDFAAILAALVQDKVSTGKTEAQARASVKSSVTAYWKRLYIDAWSRGDTEERKRIIALLTETGLYGTRNDVATLAQNWVKNSK